MEWRVTIELSCADGTKQIHDVARGGCADPHSTFDVGRRLLAGVQRHLVQARVAEYCALRRRCSHCRGVRPLKDTRTRRLNSLFGKVEMSAPRFMGPVPVPIDRQRRSCRPSGPTHSSRRGCACDAGASAAARRPWRHPEGDDGPGYAALARHQAVLLASAGKSLTGNGIGIKSLKVQMIERLTGLVVCDSLALQQEERFAMPWNETDREKYAVIRQRYASDLSDEEFALVQPLLPARLCCMDLG
jgi:hypothetical protein